MTREELFLPGDRVIVFDPLLFKDDVSTPLSFTRRPATVIRHYGYKYVLPFDPEPCVYPSCVDVVFDHRQERESHGHFASGVQRKLAVSALLWSAASALCSKLRGKDAR